MRSYAALAIAAVAACGGGHEDTPPPAPKPPPAPDARVAATIDAGTPNTYVGSARCGDCHEKELAAWKTDWHAKALAPGTGDAVVGNFASARFTGSSSEASMTRAGATRVMRTKGTDGALADFKVDYVIGGRRMQDDVTVFPDGRWQVLPVYFHVTTHEWVDYTETKQGALTPDHPFYWTNVRRMANHECLDCHTTDVRVSYDDASRAWTTAFTDGSVACEACHGPGGRHADSQAKKDIVQPAKAGPVGVSACARCHGPRQPLWPLLDTVHAFELGQTYDEMYDPIVVSLPDGGISSDYFVDGRPSTSSFEYQAMLQSACYRKGKATCLTCHTAPHAEHHGKSELRKDPDALCAGCHGDLPKEHSHHKATTCIACHMPPVVSGVLDHFADHAIDVPDPRNARVHGVTDACSTCHADRSDVEAKLAAWWPDAGKRRARRDRLADAFDPATAKDSARPLLVVIADRDEAPTLRGAAAIVLARRFGKPTAPRLIPLLGERDVVLRAKGCEALGAARAAGTEVARLLDDPSLRVRLAAALALSDSRDPRGESALQALADAPDTAGLMLPHYELGMAKGRHDDFAGARAQLAIVAKIAPYFTDADRRARGGERRARRLRGGAPARRPGVANGAREQARAGAEGTAAALVIGRAERDPRREHLEIRGRERRLAHRHLHAGTHALAVELREQIAVREVARDDDHARVFALGRGLADERAVRPAGRAVAHRRPAVIEDRRDIARERHARRGAIARHRRARGVAGWRGIGRRSRIDQRLERLRAAGAQRDGKQQAHRAKRMHVRDQAAWSPVRVTPDRRTTRARARGTVVVQEDHRMQIDRWAAAALLATCGCTTDATTTTTTDDIQLPRCALTERYELRGVGGANFNTLSVDPAILPLSQVGAVLAVDQIHMLRMAGDDGLAVLNKHVPAFMVFDAQGNPQSIEAGGFYQCATHADCQGYLDDVVAKYTLDGVPFLDRPEFHHSFSGHAYEDLGGAQFTEVTADYAIKIIRWHVGASIDPRPLLRVLWETYTRDQACKRGLAQAHLLYSPTEHVVAEVTIGERVDPAPGDPTPYFVETLGALAGQPPLDPFDQIPWLTRIPPPVTDTYLVLTYWPGATDPSLWPNSPSTTPGGPLPEPFCGDGACNITATDVETAASCPADCAPTCGNGTCDPGEDGMTCAIDCPP